MFMIFIMIVSELCSQHRVIENKMKSECNGFDQTGENKYYVILRMATKDVFFFKTLTLGKLCNGLTNKDHSVIILRSFSAKKLKFNKHIHVNSKSAGQCYFYLNKVYFTKINKSPSFRCMNFLLFLFSFSKGNSPTWTLKSSHFYK